MRDELTYVLPVIRPPGFYLTASFFDVVWWPVFFLLVIERDESKPVAVYYKFVLKLR